MAAYTNTLGQAVVFNESSASITVPKALPAYRVGPVQVEIRPNPANTGIVRVWINSNKASVSDPGAIILSSGTQPIFLNVPSGDLGDLSFLPAVVNEGIIVSVNVKGGGGGVVAVGGGGGAGGSGGGAPGGDGGGPGGPPTL